MFLVDLKKSNISRWRVETAKAPVLLIFHPNQIVNSSQKLSVVCQGNFYQVDEISSKLMKLISWFIWLAWWKEIFQYYYWFTKDLSCLKLKWPWWSAILQASKMCAVVQILFLHKKEDDSVISLQRFKLLGLGSVSNVAPKPKRSKRKALPAMFSKRGYFSQNHTI